MAALAGQLPQRNAGYSRDRALLRLERWLFSFLGPVEVVRTMRAVPCETGLL